MLVPWKEAEAGLRWRRVEKGRREKTGVRDQETKDASRRRRCRGERALVTMKGDADSENRRILTHHTRRPFSGEETDPNNWNPENVQGNMRTLL